MHTCAKTGTFNEMLIHMSHTGSEKKTVDKVLYVSDLLDLVCGTRRCKSVSAGNH